MDLAFPQQIIKPNLFVLFILSLAAVTSFGSKLGKSISVIKF